MKKFRFAAGLIGAFALTASALTLMTESATAQYEKPSMEKIETVKIGEMAPDFTLVDLDGKKHTLSDYTKAGKTVVVEWFNPMCPYCVFHYKAGTMTKTFEKFKGEDVVWLLVNSAAPMSGTGSPALNAEKKKEWGFDFPVLLDTNGAVGKSYAAKTTPHMFIIDNEGVLRYDGALDNNRRPAPVADEATYVNYVEQGLKQVLAGETVTSEKTKSYGCSVKY